MLFLKKVFDDKYFYLQVVFELHNFHVNTTQRF